MSDFADEVPLASVPAFTRFLEAGEAVTPPVSAFGSPRPPLHGVATWFSAPLRVGGRALGTLQGDRDGALTPEQLLLARGLANHAAVVLKRASCAPSSPPCGVQAPGRGSAVQSSGDRRLCVPSANIDQESRGAPDTGKVAGPRRSAQSNELRSTPFRRPARHDWYRSEGKRGVGRHRWARWMTPVAKWRANRCGGGKSRSLHVAGSYERADPASSAARR